MNKPNQAPIQTKVLALKAIAAAVALSAAGAVHAAWEVSPTVSVEASSDDNIRLATQNEDDGMVGVATAQVRVRNFTERNDVSANVGINYVTYSGIDNIDDKDSQFADFRARRKYERAGIGITGSYRRDTLLRTSRFIPADDPFLDDEVVFEDEDVDLDINAGQDDGVYRAQIRRERLVLSPNANYQFNERLSGSLGYTFLQTDFEEVAGVTGLQDSTTNAVNGGLRYRISEQDNVTLNLRVGNFDPDNRGETDTYEARVGWRHTISQSTSMNLEIGTRRVETDDEEEDGMLYRAGINHRLERGRLSFVAERSLYPSSFGEVIETDRINAGYSVQLSERLSFGANVRGMSTESSAGRNNRRNRDFVQADAGLSYLLTPTMYIGASYAFRWVERESDRDSAQSNVFTLSLSYAPRN